MPPLVWLNDVQRMAKQHGHSHHNNADGTIYKNMLQSQLQQIDDRLEQYKQQLNSLKEQCVYLTSTFEEAINYIVESDGMKYVRAQYDAQSGLLECDYDTIMLERAFLQEKPTEYQIETTHGLYNLRYEYEKARRSLMELKQSVFLHRIPSDLHPNMLDIVKSVETTSYNRHEQLIRQKMTDYMEFVLLVLNKPIINVNKT